jgi:hypothetical protein
MRSQRRRRQRAAGGDGEVVPTTTLSVNGAGDGTCNGQYVWIADNNWGGWSGHFILENVGGFRAVLYDQSFSSRYALPLGEEFLSGMWVAQEAAPPAPTVRYV